MKKIAIVLSGAGVYDGAEIHEAVMAMLAVKRNGAEYLMYAPDIPQYHVVNHLTGEQANEQRNVLVESARIARGNIYPLNDLNLNEVDALLFPGGFGAAKNLSTYAYEGSSYSVQPEVEQVIKNAHKQGKVIGAMCISPVLLAKAIPGAAVTLGGKGDAVDAIEKQGAAHVETTHGEVTVDKHNKLVTTPCYMLDADITQIADGADTLVKAMLALM